MTAGNDVTWVECPRDAWQGIAHPIATGDKRAHLQALLDAGFSRIDAGSFVSPKAVPQLADSERVLDGLRVPEGADVLCIVGNERGLERAQATPAVTSIGYPLSVNDTFQRRNVGRSLQESWPVVEHLALGAGASGLGFVVYLSMGFGNPYGDPWEPADTAARVSRLRAMGVTRIALADTVGNADAERVAAVLAAVDAHAPSGASGLGLHLHARPGRWDGPVAVALERGVRWFEGALGGIGGCPFAADDLVGNVPTEAALPWLARRGWRCGVDLARLPALAEQAARLARPLG
ncbi:MAG: hydroxymethylglutaryl-CoA lyase [Trueperaceae bacterium]